MRDLFPGYYKPTDEAFAELWQNCIFAFDANVLLDLYRYKPDTRDQLLTVMESVDDRLWLPYQAAYEYQKNRLQVIGTQTGAYNELTGKLEASLNGLTGALNAFNKHPLIDVKEIVQRIEALFQALKVELNQKKEQHDQQFPPIALEDDEVRDRLDHLFDGRVGKPYDDKKLAEVKKDGEERYKNNTPPGYADKNKAENKYGDFIVWWQTLEHAAEQEKPVIFVTNDNKEDWWLSAGGKTLAPRPELIEEMRSKTKQGGYIYSADRFMEYAKTYLKQEVTQEAIEEVHSLAEAQKPVAEIVGEGWNPFMGNLIMSPAWKQISDTSREQFAQAHETMVKNILQGAAPGGLEKAMSMAIGKQFNLQVSDTLRDIQQSQREQIERIAKSLTLTPIPSFGHILYTPKRYSLPAIPYTASSEDEGLDEDEAGDS